jgi:hypothetical protein
MKWTWGPGNSSPMHKQRNPAAPLVLIEVSGTTRSHTVPEDPMAVFKEFGDAAQPFSRRVFPSPSGSGQA